MFINKYTLSSNNITYHHTSDTVNMSTEHQCWNELFKLFKYWNSLDWIVVFGLYSIIFQEPNTKADR